MKKIPPELLLSQVEEVLRTMPSAGDFRARKPETYAWSGRASAVVHGWDSVRAITKFDPAVSKLSHSLPHISDAGIGEALTCLHQIRHDLCMQTQSPLSVSVGSGLVFDYFDELRKAIETAKQDILFVDPYLDAEFVSRYLPHISNGVEVRLLASKKVASLVPAVASFSQQSEQSIQIRSADGFHDRYVIIDRSICYQSGASFKDGAKKAPTTLTQILDAFVAVQATYEKLWDQGRVEQ